MKYKLRFMPDNKVIFVEEGEGILHCAAQAGILIDGSCNGRGTCGMCRIQILEGKADPVDSQGWGLACQIRVMDQLTIFVPDIHSGTDRKKNMNDLPNWFTPKPDTKKHFITVPKAVIGTQVNDLDRIRQVLKMKDLRFHPSALGQIQQAIAAQRGRMTLTMQRDLVISAEAGETSSQCFGMAFDIGTTTVVGSLWDMTKGIMVDAEAETNPQSTYGADVISRIQYCMEEEEHVETLHDMVIQCCNEMIGRLVQRNQIAKEQIYGASVAGNTTMSHIFWGISPKSMAKIPFAPVFCESLQTDAESLGIDINPRGRIHLLPNIAGHVGSDITGVMIATGLEELSGNTIAIDVGTNGEILVASEGRILACSTAAGPAFEGACIRDGMRAAPGAIESVVIGGKIDLQVIGGGQAVGICGSGLIDGIAELIKAKVISKNGNLLEREQAEERGLPEFILERLVGTGREAAFVLAEGERQIAITQADIREVQLAKGAILGGMQTLMKKLCISLEEIDRVLVAGAFGSYIKKESAIGIGILPDIEEEKVCSIGNGAGIGAAMALLSEEVCRRAEEEVKKIQHVELAKDPDFQDFYIEGMLFEKAAY